MAESEEAVTAGRMPEDAAPAAAEKSGPSTAGDNPDDQVRKTLNASADLVFSQLRAARSVIVIVDWDLPEAARQQMPLGIIRTLDGRVTNDRVISSMHGVLKFFEYLQGLVFKLCQMAIDKAAASQDPGPR